MTYGGIPNSDQLFLLYFITGTYFGPDLKEEKPRKSVLQRRTQSLSQYSSIQLAHSHVRTADVEQVYYHVLRKADQTLAVKPTLLQHYLQGTIPTFQNEPTAIYPQFTDLFPPQLHPQSQFKSRYKIIANIVFINDPDTSYSDPEDIERFKRLTDVDDLHLDIDVPTFCTSVDDSGLYNVVVQQAALDAKLPHAGLSHSSGQLVHVVAPIRSVAYNPTRGYVDPLLSEDNDESIEKAGPRIIFLPSCKDKERWASLLDATKNGFVLTGSVVMGKVGPVVGLMDIGEYEDSYLFRVSLPGVKRDEKNFSCEITNDGEVLIKGITTTGERYVRKFSQMFKMQSTNLCPPGPFSVTFQLPGTVNAHRFKGNFGTDGILEGIVKKQKH